MDSFELNKIIAAVLLAALIIIGIGKFADVLFYVQKPEQSAYKVDGLEVVTTSKDGASEAAKEIKEVNIKELLALGDVTHGEKVFKNCSACHMIVSGGKNMIGPNLWGVIGRNAAAINDYNYSKAMKDFIARQPMGRIGYAEEIAALAVYLGSDESNFTTGHAHVIDGGWSNLSGIKNEK